MTETRKLRVTTRKTEEQRIPRRKPIARGTGKRTRALASNECDRAMKRPTTSVLVRANPLQPIAALNTKIPSMAAALKGVLAHVSAAMREKKLGPHALMLHEDKCAFGAIVWPRAATPNDVDEMHDAIAERNEGCTCSYLVMYPGAQA